MNASCLSGRRSRIARAKLLDALAAAKHDSIGFLHFGCCEIVDRRERRRSLEELLQASGSRWVSGYTQAVDWLRSTMLDLALVAEFYVQFHRSRGRCGPRLKAPARQFVSDYEQLARSLGFSGLSRDSNGDRHQMFPPRLRDRRGRNTGVGIEVGIGTGIRIWGEFRNLSFWDSLASGC